ncbi:hypothetical protein [Streptomyces rubellomurinus]|uniref:hypothetical protein n=1 Tax=Streptomyces rubellomurinus (strain ATCC 31215) TaxID=359131 RepID=UPI000697BF89|nr:hypothetical protein [Streptomyces rubellomurinus]
MSKKAPGAPPRFVLWREVLASYAMPAVTAGLGGAVSQQHQLAVAALTTIGGTSALVAALLGAVLRRRPVRARPPRTPRALAAATLGLVAAALGLAAGLAAAHWLPHLPALADSPWPRRLPVDLPVSAAIAGTVVTWRWRGTRPTHRTPHPTPSPTPSPSPISAASTTRPERRSA